MEDRQIIRGLVDKIDSLCNKIWEQENPLKSLALEKVLEGWLRDEEGGGFAHDDLYDMPESELLELIAEIEELSP